MIKSYKRLLILALLLIAGTLTAGEDVRQQSQDSQARNESASMLQDAEKAREEAEVARQEATRVAETARKISEKQAQLARTASGNVQQDTEDMHRAQEAEQAEVARARAELSRAHRELREASREVAQAHRALSRSVWDVEIDAETNFGDRAVIGVVLGRPTEDGVKLIGVSPDGPAERAGLQPGDVLESIRGEDLTGDEDSRQSVIQVMREVSDGEELLVIANRDGQTLEFRVTAEQREPRSWHSVMSVEEIIEDPEFPHSSSVISRSFEVPEIDEVALAAEIAELSERIEATSNLFVIHDGEQVQEWEITQFSDIGSQAMSEANIWFDLPQAHGLELVSINAGLGAYFETDRGVLVIRARENNSYQLVSGDVILSIDLTEVNNPSDVIRALRDVEPGGAIKIEIKRDRKSRSLSVTVPENRLGQR